MLIFSITLHDQLRKTCHDLAYTFQVVNTEIDSRGVLHLKDDSVTPMMCNVVQPVLPAHTTLEFKVKEIFGA